MQIFVIGTNHKHSSRELREKVFLSRKKRQETVLFIKESRYLKGAIPLSTCSRTEVYAVSRDNELGIKEVQELFSRLSGLGEKEIFSQFYTYTGEEAVQHLCNVCAGLDSMILGETQVLAQVKDALRLAEKSGMVSPRIRDMFHFAIFVAKKVHAETGVSEGKLSIGSVTADLLEREFETIAGKRILIIGVGKVTELLLKYIGEDVGVVFVANRTYEKARKLANRIGGEVARFNDLENIIKRTDIIISATASPHFILRPNMLSRTERPVVIVDLAVPRDVDPAIGKLRNVNLYDFEDLEHIVAKRFRKRKCEVGAARRIMREERERRWEKHINLEPEKVLWP